MIRFSKTRLLGHSLLWVRSQLKVRRALCLSLSCAGLISLLATVLTPEARADQVQYLPTPLQSLAALEQMIAGAQKSIAATYYILEPCSASTQLLMNRLKERARAGVHVRVLIDAMLQDEESQNQLSADFAKSGIELRYFNGGFIGSPGQNFRSHIKFIVVDGKALISGGRNIDDGYFGLSNDLNYVDRDVRVEGRAAAAAESAFEELWNFQLSKAVSAVPRTLDWSKACDINFPSKLSELKALLAKKRTSALTSTPTHECSDVTFIADHPDFLNPEYGIQDLARGQHPSEFMTSARIQRKSTSSAYLKFISETTSHLEIENWSYLPAGQLDLAFQSLRERQIPTLVLTNLESDNVEPIKSAEDHLDYLAARRDSVGSQRVLQLPRNGSLYSGHELTPKNTQFFMHMKVAMRDGRDGWVSSFNLDPRSYETNLESAVWVQNCPAFVKDMTRESVAVENIFLADVKTGFAQTPEPMSPISTILAAIGFHLF